MRIHTYQIADLLLGIEADEKYLHTELQAFETIDSTEPQILIRLIPSGSPLQYSGSLLIHSELLDIYDNNTCYYIIYRQEASSVFGYILKKDTREAIVYIKAAAPATGTEIMYSIRDSFFFYMQQYQRVAIHSASILYQGYAWLFAAPSGTGKSTHVQLWKEAGYPSEDLNGDVAVCYLSPEGIPLAAGLPWCCTSGIYRNKTMPLGGVIFLNQSSSDKVIPVPAARGILLLTARCLTPAWNQAMMTRNLHICQALSGHILLCRLDCTIQPAAAALMKAYIDEHIS